MRAISSTWKILAAAFLIRAWMVPPGLAAVPNVSRADLALSNYFRVETQRLAGRCLSDVTSLDDWEEKRPHLRAQLFEMLSLSPLPPRTALRAEVTGTLETDGFTVEKLHFESMPGLYVTANLYLPKNLAQPAPAILYVCGHAQVVTNGVSYGNKTAYQHHGAWFAQNGYVCLTLDTVQLGEIQGIHHGTYREGMWWWNSRGYTSAGVEAWNCIRALDYLETRPEVDRTRFGVTGRSGGGAYSWWVAALDERIQVAAPVAGMTDLQNHVVDGVVEGHCDCMFPLNTYRWDFPMIAALVAPRPLLICNSDKDTIFPLDGVVRLHAKVAPIYRLYGAANQLGLLITDGPHKDTQDLQLPVFRWFNRHLQKREPLIDLAARPFFTPQQLKVFEQLPADERTSRIHESFVPIGACAIPPTNRLEWAARRQGITNALVEHVFAGWPDARVPLALTLRAEESRERDRLAIYEFASDHDVPLRLYVHAGHGPGRTIRLTVRDESDWHRWLNSAASRFPQALREESAGLDLQSSEAADLLPPPEGVIEVGFAPRGIGWSAWSGPERKQIQVRRRFMLLGQTLDSMRVWDIRRSVQALRTLEGCAGLPMALESRGGMGINVLYAALFEPNIHRVRLVQPPASHQSGPDYLNVLRFTDVPQTAALVAESALVEVVESAPDAWSFPAAVQSALAWGPERFRVSPWTAR